MKKISFNTRLDSTHWDPDIGGWNCSALKIPGATVSSIFSGGTKVDERSYGVLNENSIITWPKELPRPEQIVVNIKLKNTLVSNKWQHLSILLPFIATILSAFIASNSKIVSSIFKSGGQDTMAVRWKDSIRIRYHDSTVLKTSNVSHRANIQSILGSWTKVTPGSTNEIWRAEASSNENLFYVYKEPEDIGIGIGSYDDHNKTFSINYYSRLKSRNCFQKLTITWVLQRPGQIEVHMVATDTNCSGNDVDGGGYILVKPQ